MEQKRYGSRGRSVDASSPPLTIAAGFGLAVSPVNEDREALEINMRSHGFGAAETTKALEIGTAGLLQFCEPR